MVFVKKKKDSSLNETKTTYMITNLDTKFTTTNLMRLITYLWLATVGQIVLLEQEGIALPSLFGYFSACVPSFITGDLTYLKFTRVVLKYLRNTSTRLIRKRKPTSMYYRLEYRENKTCYNPWSHGTQFHMLFADICANNEDNYLYNAVLFQMICRFFMVYEVKLFVEQCTPCWAFISACAVLLEEIATKDENNLQLVHLVDSYKAYKNNYKEGGILHNNVIYEIAARTEYYCKNFKEGKEDKHGSMLSTKETLTEGGF